MPDYGIGAPKKMRVPGYFAVQSRIYVHLYGLSTLLCRFVGKPKKSPDSEVRGFCVDRLDAYRLSLS